MSKPLVTRRLSIPVQFVDGKWECVLGGEVLVKEGTQAQLVIERGAITDKAFLAMMERKERHKVLDQGTPLLIGLTVKPSHPPRSDQSHLLIPFRDRRDKIAMEYLDTWHPTHSHFVQVTLDDPTDQQIRMFDMDNGGLWLVTKGVEAVGLSSTTIRLSPQISKTTVASLNHAFTKLSEAFESWRISHTGNIYTRVLYQERDGRWYPLDLLRNAALGKQEQEIARGLWDGFMAKMTTAPKTAKRK